MKTAQAVTAALTLTALTAPDLLKGQCLPGTPVTGLNLSGTNPTNTSYTVGPGAAAFETVPAPNGNTNLYQRNIPVDTFQQNTSGALTSVSGMFFGSQNSNNIAVPVDLRTVPGNIICSVWTNGFSGFAANPKQPNFQFNAGSTTNLIQRGSITNNATGIVYPTYAATADLAGAGQCRPLNAGESYAIGLHIQYTAVSPVTARLCQTSLTNSTTHATALSGAFNGAGTNITTIPLSSMSFSFTPYYTNEVRIQKTGANQAQVSFIGDVGRFVRLESSTNLTSWTPLASAGTPPAATVSTADASSKFFRAVMTP